MSGAALPVSPCGILLPRDGIDLKKWAVIACDQYTQDKSYWDRVRDAAGGEPSAIDLILPEAYLETAGISVPRIHEAMARYVDGGVLVPRVSNGYVYVERSTSTGMRRGLVCAVDLDAYDPSPDWKGPICATEGVVPERVPPRAFIRRGAPVELPHVLMLADDPEDRLFSFLSENRDGLPKLYDLDLAFGGGHIAGYAVDGEDACRVTRILEKLRSGSGSVFLAVGDGNHSLAAAKAVREEYRKALPADQSALHPSRWALTEVCNIHDPSLVFEPIYRILYGVTAQQALECLPECCSDGGTDMTLLSRGGRRDFSARVLPVRAAQDMTDLILRRVPGSRADYIHGLGAVRALLESDDRVAILPRVIEKNELFPYVEKYGPLPRKAFSMGQASDKRYYMEARRIV